MSWVNGTGFEVGDRVEYIGDDDDPRFKSSRRGIVSSTQMHLDSWQGQPDRPIGVRMFNGWVCSFAPEDLRVLTTTEGVN